MPIDKKCHKIYDCEQITPSYSGLCNNDYLILGHGLTPNPERITIPENINVVTFSQIGEEFTSSFDLLFLELFSYMENRRPFFDSLLKILVSILWKFKIFRFRF